MRKDYAVIFDLDGTLLDTASLIKASFNYTFNKLMPGYIVSDQEHKSFLGPSLYDSFSRYFDSKEEVMLAVETYQEHNLYHQEEFVTIYDDAINTLEYLKDTGYPLAIVSTKRREAVMIGLRLFNLQDYFDIILTHEDVKKVKPDPEGILKTLQHLKVSTGMYVGDNASDILAGKNANVDTVGVYYSNNLNQLLESKPDLMVHTIKEIIPYIKEKQIC